MQALELIGKELGMFIDRKEVGGPNEFERMSDEELEAFLLEIPSTHCHYCTMGVQSGSEASGCSRATMALTDASGRFSALPITEGLGVRRDLR